MIRPLFPVRRTRLSLLPMLTLLGSLSACSTLGPDYQRPALPIPVEYSNALAARDTQAAALESDWWQLFGDSTLQHLIAAAHAHNPDLAAARARLAQARSLQQVQDASSAPSAAAGAKISSDRISKHSEMLANLPVKNVNTDFTNHQIGFDASWELDLFGRQQRISEAAAAHSASAAEKVREVRLVLAAEVARNYLDLRASQLRLQLAQQQAASLGETLRLSRLAQQAGELSRSEVLRAETAFENANAALPNLAAAITQNLSALAVLSGENFGVLQSRLQTPAQALPPLPPPPATGLPSELLQRRPDIVASERELIAANAEIGIAEAAKYPHFSLSGQGGWTSIASGNLLQKASQNFVIGPQLALPLFTAGRLQSQVDASRAASAAAQAAYRKSVLSAVAEVEGNLQRVQQSAQRQQAAERALAQAQAQLQFAQSQWTQGESARFPLLEAERNRNSQHDALLQAQAQSLQAMLALYKSLGGAW